MTTEDHGTATAGAQTSSLCRFLAGVRPFDALEPMQLEAVAAAAEVRQFAAGDLVVDAFTAPPTEIYVVLAGEVDLWHDPDQVTKAGDDRFVAGDVFGFSAMLTERPVGPRVVATTAARIAVLRGDLVEPAFYSRSGARFLADYISRIRRLATAAPAFSTVEDLIATTPLVVSPETTVAAIARRLDEHDQHCAVVDSGDGTYGIVTDAALGRKVVGNGLSTDTPARAVMTHPAATVEISDSSMEALITLLDSRTEYVPVIDRAGTLRGVVGARDFVLAPTTAGVGMLERIRRTRSRAELIERARHAPAVLGDIHDRGLAADRAIRVYSAIIDAIIRRSIALVFTGHPDLPLDRFTWLSLGSHGRREAVPSSDVDAAIAFDDDVPQETVVRYRKVFGEVNDLLTEVGLSVDVNGANASNKSFSRTNSEWRAAATRWLTAPEEHSQATMAVQRKGLAVIASLLVDARPIHGKPGLPAVARVFADFRQHPATMDMLLSESLSHRAKVRDRTLRDLLTGKEDAFNVKTHGLLPVVSIARWAALGVGSTELQTVKRLRDASGSAILPSPQADRLIEAFEILQRLRLHHHLNRIHRGQPPTDLIDRDELSPIERSMIGQVVQEINTIARRMDRVSRRDTPLPRLTRRKAK
jgi:CBS domain-containing protein